MLALFTPYRAALILFSIAFATIAGAWIFEWAGYLPCDLCLKQRWAYYIAVPLALICLVATRTGPPAFAKAMFVLLMVTFAASAIFGAYHAGVEWGFWPGPAGCSGAPQSAANMNDFMKQLQTSKVVRCDEVAIRILGLSLAGWNAIISAGLSLLAGKSVFSED